MRFTTALLIASAGFAAAQTSASSPQPTGSASECDAQNIVDACREGIQKQIDDCDGNDWMCLCDNHTNLLTCYNNCPDSNERPSVQNQVTQYCLAAAPLSSSSIAAAKTRPVVSQATTTVAAATSAGADDAIGFGSGTATGEPAENTNAAGALVVPAGLGALLGVAAFL